MKDIKKDIKKIVKETFEKLDNLKCDICHKNKATQLSRSVYPMFLCDDCYDKRLKYSEELVEDLMKEDNLKKSIEETIKKYKKKNHKK